MAVMNVQRRQQGITLVELMISLAIGLFVLLVASSVYVTSVVSSLESIESSRLNQEMSTLMSIMVQDIRRAGYSSDTSVISSPLSNVFNVTGDTALTVIQGVANPTTVIPLGPLTSPTVPGSCILYSYDANENQVVDDNENFGFRLTANGVVQMRESRAAANAGNVHCNEVGDVWNDVTDGVLINVTSLVFDTQNSDCQNSSEPDGEDNDTDGTVDDADEADCYADAPASGDITVETRQVVISLAAELRSDPQVNLSISQIVRVRNDLLRRTP